ncbi:MAG: thioredoxin family protein [Candidatus Thorarchaeota archaeon]|jgi:thioredoxin-like negative regulator of GroEL
MPEGGKDKEFSFDALSKNLEGRLSSSPDDAAATGKVRELTKPDIVSSIRLSPTSIVLFYRDDCPFCERLMPILDELADDYKSQVAFAKANVDTIEDTREEYNVQGVPLIVAFKKGMPVGRIEGLRSMDDYDQWIESIHSGLRPMGIDEGPTTPLE